MAVVQATIKAAILASINGNGGSLTPEQSINKFADDLATIIKNAIESGEVSVLNTELTAKVVCAAPGSPVVCTTPLLGSIT